jgi:hypothetical protein
MFPLESALPNQDSVADFGPAALVRHCVDTGDPFGVVLISRGREVVAAIRVVVGILSRSPNADHGVDRPHFAAGPVADSRVSG